METMIAVLCISTAILGIIIIYLTIKLIGAENEIERLDRVFGYSKDVNKIWRDSFSKKLENTTNDLLGVESKLKALEPLRELAIEIEKEKKRIEFEHKKEMIVSLIDLADTIIHRQCKKDIPIKRFYKQGEKCKNDVFKGTISINKPKKSVVKQVKKPKKK